MRFLTRRTAAPCISSSLHLAGQRTTCTIIAPGASAWSRWVSSPGTSSSSPSCCSSAPPRWCWPPSRSSMAALGASAAFARGNRDLLRCQEAGAQRRCHPWVSLSWWQMPWRGYGTSCDTGLVQDRQTPPWGTDTEVRSACKELPPRRALRPGSTSSSTLERMSLGLAAGRDWKPAL